MNEYIDQLMVDIAYAKEHNRAGVFRINDKITDELAIKTKAYLEENLPVNYRVEFKKCAACMGTWDILIFF